MLTLEDAERSAGVRTRAHRAPDSTIIDICTIDTSDKSSSYDSQFREELRRLTRSKTLFLDPSYGGTLVALDFEEAHLAKKVFKALKLNGHRPSYRPRIRSSLRLKRLQP